MGLFILFLFFTRNPRRCCPERSLVSVGLSLSTAATAAGHPLLQLALSRLPPPARIGSDQTDLFTAWHAAPQMSALVRLVLVVRQVVN